MTYNPLENMVNIANGTPPAAPKPNPLVNNTLPVTPNVALQNMVKLATSQSTQYSQNNPLDITNNPDFNIEELQSRQTKELPYGAVGFKIDGTADYGTGWNGYWNGVFSRINQPNVYQDADGNYKETKPGLLEKGLRTGVEALTTFFYPVIEFQNFLFEKAADIRTLDQLVKYKRGDTQSYYVNNDYFESNRKFFQASFSALTGTQYLENMQNEIISGTQKIDPNFVNKVRGANQLWMKRNFGTELSDQSLYEDYMRRVMDGENAEDVIKSTEKFWWNLAGSFFYDWSNPLFFGTGGIWKSLGLASKAKFLAPLAKVEKEAALFAKEGGILVGSPEFVEALPKIVKNAIEYTSEAAKGRKILGGGFFDVVQSSRSKRLSETMGQVLLPIIAVHKQDTAKALTLLEAIYKIGSGNEQLVIEGYTTMTEIAPKMVSNFSSGAGLETAEYFSKLGSKFDGIFTEEALKTFKGGNTADIFRELGKKSDEIGKEMYPSVLELEKKQRLFSKAVPGTAEYEALLPYSEFKVPGYAKKLALVNDFFQNTAGFRKINNAFSTVYIVAQPGVAARNMINNVFTAMIDMNPLIILDVFQEARMLKEIKSMMGGFIPEEVSRGFGKGATVYGIEKPTNMFARAFEWMGNLTTRGEQMTAAAVMNASMKKSLKSFMKVGGALADTAGLKAKGFTDDQINRLTYLSQIHFGDMDKVIAQFSKEHALGVFDRFRDIDYLLSDAPGVLSLIKKDPELMDKIITGLQNASSLEEAVNMLTTITRKWSEQAAADHVANWASIFDESLWEIAEVQSLFEMIPESELSRWGKLELKAATIQANKIAVRKMIIDDTISALQAGINKFFTKDDAKKSQLLNKLLDIRKGKEATTLSVTRFGTPLKITDLSLLKEDMSQNITKFIGEKRAKIYTDMSIMAYLNEAKKLFPDIERYIDFTTIANKQDFASAFYNLYNGEFWAHCYETTLMQDFFPKVQKFAKETIVGMKDGVKITLADTENYRRMMRSNADLTRFFSVRDMEGGRLFVNDFVDKVMNGDTMGVVGMMYENIRRKGIVKRAADLIEKIETPEAVAEAAAPKVHEAILKVRDPNTVERALHRASDEKRTKDVLEAWVESKKGVVDMGGAADTIYADLWDVFSAETLAANPNITQDELAEKFLKTMTTFGPESGKTREVALADFVEQKIADAIDNVAPVADNVAGAVDNVAGAVDNVAGAVDNVAAAVDNVAPAVQQAPIAKTAAEVTADNILDNNLPEFDDLRKLISERGFNARTKFEERLKFLKTQEMTDAVKNETRVLKELISNINSGKRIVKQEFAGKFAKAAVKEVPKEVPKVDDLEQAAVKIQAEFSTIRGEDTGLSVRQKSVRAVKERKQIVKQQLLSAKEELEQDMAKAINNADEDAIAAIDKSLMELEQKELAAKAAVVEVVQDPTQLPITGLSPDDVVINPKPDPNSALFVSFKQPVAKTAAEVTADNILFSNFPEFDTLKELIFERGFNARTQFNERIRFLKTQEKTEAVKNELRVLKELVGNINAGRRALKKELLDNAIGVVKEKSLPKRIQEVSDLLADAEDLVIPQANSHIPNAYNKLMSFAQENKVNLWLSDEVRKLREVAITRKKSLENGILESLDNEKLYNQRKQAEWDKIFGEGEDLTNAIRPEYVKEREILSNEIAHIDDFLNSGKIGDWDEYLKLSGTDDVSRQFGEATTRDGLESPAEYIDDLIERFNKSNLSPDGTPSSIDQEITELSTRDGHFGYDADFHPVKLTDEEVAERTQAIKASFELGELNENGFPVNGVLGLRIPKNFRMYGESMLVGETVESTADVATLAQVYRHPAYETSRLIFTQTMPDGTMKIVGERSITAKIPHSTPGVFQEGLYNEAELAKDLENWGADGFYSMHNHPSSRVTASEADKVNALTKSAKFPQYHGSIIINHNEYNFIDTVGNEQITQLSKDTSRIPIPETYDLNDIQQHVVRHPLIGQRMKARENMDAIVDLVSKTRHDPSKAVLIGYGSDTKITYIGEFDISSIPSSGSFSTYMGRAGNVDDISDFMIDGSVTNMMLDNVGENLATIRKGSGSVGFFLADVDLNLIDATQQRHLEKMFNSGQFYDVLYKKGGEYSLIDGGEASSRELSRRAFTSSAHMSNGSTFASFSDTMDDIDPESIVDNLSWHGVEIDKEILPAEIEDVQKKAEYAYDAYDNANGLPHKRFYVGGEGQQLQNEIGHLNSELNRIQRLMDGTYHDIGAIGKAPKGKDLQEKALEKATDFAEDPIDAAYTAWKESDYKSKKVMLQRQIDVRSKDVIIDPPLKPGEKPHAPRAPQKTFRVIYADDLQNRITYEQHMLVQDTHYRNELNKLAEKAKTENMPKAALDDYLAHIKSELNHPQFSEQERLMHIEELKSQYNELRITDPEEMKKFEFNRYNKRIEQARTIQKNLKKSNFDTAQKYDMAVYKQQHEIERLTKLRDATKKPDYIPLPMRKQRKPQFLEVKVAVDNSLVEAGYKPTKFISTSTVNAYHDGRIVDTLVGLMTDLKIKIDDLKLVPQKPVFKDGALTNMAEKSVKEQMMEVGQKVTAEVAERERLDKLRIFKEKGVLNKVVNPINSFINQLPEDFHILNDAGKKISVAAKKSKERFLASVKKGQKILDLKQEKELFQKGTHTLETVVIERGSLRAKFTNFMNAHFSINGTTFRAEDKAAYDLFEGIVAQNYEKKSLFSWLKKNVEKTNGAYHSRDDIANFITAKWKRVRELKGKFSKSLVKIAPDKIASTIEGTMQDLPKFLHPSVLTPKEEVLSANYFDRLNGIVAGALKYMKDGNIEKIDSEYREAVMKIATDQESRMKLVKFLQMYNPKKSGWNVFEDWGEEFTTHSISKFEDRISKIRLGSDFKSLDAPQIDPEEIAAVNKELAEIEASLPKSLLGIMDGSPNEIETLTNNVTRYAAYTSGLVDRGMDPREAGARTKKVTDFLNRYVVSEDGMRQVETVREVPEIPGDVKGKWVKSITKENIRPARRELSSFSAEEIDIAVNNYMTAQAKHILSVPEGMRTDSMNQFLERNFTNEELGKLNKIVKPNQDVLKVVQDMKDWEANVLNEMSESARLAISVYPKGSVEDELLTFINNIRPDKAKMVNDLSKLDPETVLESFLTHFEGQGIEIPELWKNGIRQDFKNGDYSKAIERIKRIAARQAKYGDPLVDGIKVINIRESGIKPETLPEDIVYIGRSTGKWKSTKYGNPFTWDKNNPQRILYKGKEVGAAEFPTEASAREKVNELYEKWLRGELKKDPKFLDDLKGKHILCWCSPDLCHGDVLKKVAMEQLEGTAEELAPKTWRVTGTGVGRGTALGDEKDVAMRLHSNFAIVEIVTDKKPSSSLTSWQELGSPTGDLSNSAIMLARNGELRGTPLRPATIAQIKKAFLAGARFNVGDMPGVDDEFYKVLDEIGARYTVFHVGENPRAVVKKAIAVDSPIPKNEQIIHANSMVTATKPEVTVPSINHEINSAGPLSNVDSASTANLENTLELQTEKTSPKAYGWMLKISSDSPLDLKKAILDSKENVTITDVGGDEITVYLNTYETNEMEDIARRISRKHKDLIKPAPQKVSANGVRAHGNVYAFIDKGKSTDVADTVIDVFRGEHNFLSNMSYSPIEIDGIKYNSVEAAFQAGKTSDPTIKLQIARMPATKAKAFGRNLPWSDEWNKTRLTHMETVLRAKFDQNPELKEKLIKTYQKLVEGGPWADSFWGYKADKGGQNNLGRLLMKLREEYFEEYSQAAAKTAEAAAPVVDNVAAAVDNVAGAVDNVAAAVDNVAPAVDNVAASADNVVAATDNVATTAGAGAGGTTPPVEPPAPPENFAEDFPPTSRPIPAPVEKTVQKTVPVEVDTRSAKPKKTVFSLKNDISNREAVIEQIFRDRKTLMNAINSSLPEGVDPVSALDELNPKHALYAINSVLMKAGQPSIQMDEFRTLLKFPPIVGDLPPSSNQIATEVLPGIQEAMDTLSEKLTNKWGQTKISAGGEMSQDQADALQAWKDSTNNRMPEYRSEAYRGAVLQRDQTLLNYGDKVNGDAAVAYLMPYQFWYSRSYKNWFKRIARNPEIAIKYLQFKNNLTNYNSDQPDYLKGQVNAQMMFPMDKPLFFNLESAINPLNGLTGVDFNDKQKIVGEPGTVEYEWTSLLNTVGKYGPSVWTPIQMATALYLKNIGETDAARRWGGRLIPQTAVLKAGAAKWFNTHLELDPMVKSMDDNPIENDPYEQRRAGRALSTLVGQNGVTAEAAFDSANSNSGPLWEQAVVKATTDRAGSTFTSFLLGSGFKARTDIDVQIDSMYSEYYNFWRNQDKYTPEEKRQYMDYLDDKYPFMNYTILSTKSGAEKDKALAYSVIARLAPGDRTTIAKEMNMDKDLFSAFLTSGGDFSKMTKVDKDKLMANVIELSGILAMPDLPTRQEWTIAVDTYNKINPLLITSFGEGILAKIDTYEALKNEDLKNAEVYLEQNKDLKSALMYKDSLIINTPVLSKFYHGISVFDDYYTASFRAEVAAKVDPNFYVFQGTRDMIVDDAERDQFDKDVNWKGLWKKYTDLKSVWDATIYNKKLDFARRFEGLDKGTTVRTDIDLLSIGQQKLVDSFAAKEAELTNNGMTWREIADTGFVSAKMEADITAFLLQNKPLPTATNSQIIRLANYLTAKYRMTFSKDDILNIASSYYAP